MSSPPQLIVLAGPNGAGKSTLAPHLLRDAMGVHEFVNADTIAQGLSGYSPERVAIEAGAILLKRLQELMENRRSFSTETTLAGRTWLNLFRRAKEEFGYRVAINYIWVRDPRLLVSRVTLRQLHGGHGVPETTILRRYYRSINLFMKEYRHLADRWALYDNTTTDLTELIAEKSSEGLVIHDAETWELLVKGNDDDR